MTWRAVASEPRESRGGVGGTAEDRGRDRGTACVSDGEEVGQRLGAWARPHGGDGRSLHAWDLALKRRGKKVGRTKLIELIPSAAVVASARYVLRVGEVAIEFGGDPRDETLRWVVEVLRTCTLRRR